MYLFMNKYNLDLFIRYLQTITQAICAKVSRFHYHHPINVPTAEAQACLMDYPYGERAITHHVGPVRIGGC
jgi:hypothetical protein